MAPPRRWGTRSFFRLCAAIPALRRRAFAGAWTTPAAPRDWERGGTTLAA